MQNQVLTSRSDSSPCSKLTFSFSSLSSFLGAIQFFALLPLVSIPLFLQTLDNTLLQTSQTREGHVKSVIEAGRRTINSPHTGMLLQTHWLSFVEHKIRYFEESWAGKLVRQLIQDHQCIITFHFYFTLFLTQSYHMVFRWSGIKRTCHIGYFYGAFLV